MQLEARLLFSFICLYQFRTSSSAKQCTLCHEQDSNMCSGIQLPYLSEAATELRIRFNYVPTLGAKTFFQRHLTSLKRIHFSRCGVTYVDSSAFYGVTNLKYLHLDRNNLASLHSDTFKDLSKLRTLDLSENRLSEISFHQKVPSVQYSTLSDNFITSLTNETFCSVQSCALITLDLSNNLILTIEQRAFQGLSYLQELNLLNNNLVTIHKDTFMNTTSLYKLNIRGNRLKQLDFIQNMVSVSNLDLSRNNISILSNGMFLATNTYQLRELKLSENKISTMENGCLIGATNLTYIDLSKNEISFMFKNIFNAVSKLERVNLNYNKLSRLEFVRKIIKLRYLHLSNNQIYLVPTGTFSQTTLELVDLSNNAITVIESGVFQGIKKLYKLFLRGNNIFKLPSNIFEKTHVHDLDLQHNKITEYNYILKGLSFYSLNFIGNNISVFSKDISSVSEVYQINDLNFANNGITTVFSRSFQRLNNLRTLNLSKNRIIDMPDNLLHNSTQFVTLDLSYNQLTNLEFVHFNPSLLYLYLSNNAISFLPNDTFTKSSISNFSKLTTIDLKNNEISNISSRAFYGVTKLEELLLSRNKIVNLHPDTFANTTELKKLDLSYNQICQLDFVLNMNSVRYLILSHNAISVLPGEAFSRSNSSQLSNIDLSNNEITTIAEKAFNNLKHLLYVNLKGNNITYPFPNSFTDTSKLIILDLSRNNISEIYIFNNTHQLITCDLSNNVMSILPNQMFSSSLPSNLCKLNLANNKISTVEYHAFNGLSSLKELDLSGNNITIIHPETFSFFRDLLKLNLNNNKISQLLFLQNIPKLNQLHLANNNIYILTNDTFSIGQTTNLNQLNLSNNGINIVEPLAFQNLPVLRYLDISRNYIQTLHPHQFGNNALLTTLDLSNNQLYDIGFFINIPSLFYCNLSSNSLTTLRSNSFGSSKTNRLKYIDLANNKISSFEEGAFHGLPKLEYLDLSGNNIINFVMDLVVESTKMKMLDLRYNSTNRGNMETFDVVEVANKELRDILRYHKVLWVPD